MNFFITGNGAIDAGLDLDFISPVNAKAGKFASKGQTLKQSYSIAQNIFRLVGKDKINFALIGLTADNLFRDDNENLTKDVFEENFQALNDYIKLCYDNGAKPIGVILPFAPSVRERYRKSFLQPLLDILAEFGIKIINFFDLELPEENFSDEIHLTEEGALKFSLNLTLTFYDYKIFSEEDFSQMSYFYFYYLSSFMMNRKNFNMILSKVFSYSVEKIRRKKKIKVAFVTDHAATWCGDRLYHLFDQNPRFETTLFMIKGKNESTLEDARHDFEQFKSAGLNVVGVFDLNEETEPQDIIFFLRPYFHNFSRNFQFNVLTPQTLCIYIPYYIETAQSFIPNYYDMPIFRLAWKYFFDSKIALKVFEQNSKTGTFHGGISGLPKMDFFFKASNKISFTWKMTRPNAKKIIWAPHWSFILQEKRETVSTFPYNYKLMYEFAKAHPETSWVVKPHPRLMLEAIKYGLFPSVEAYEEYLQKWNDLPNAQVFTGGYYQEIFATSDGLIHDSCSFIAEYQYTNKPMIFLMNNDEEEFTELGKKILDASYIVDGKNLEQIAAALQKIFIEGNDPLKAKRKKVFDEELNYKKFNGMLASDFIFKNVADELGITK